ncbi:MAG TPA: phosphoribosylanthranilate isomerase [Pyrinomonadaceae bacterium]|nr:phosphoribosylanthranilate isomerase [Pyrinomonadaceae bacterium]
MTSEQLLSNMTTHVKICGITNERDAVAAVEAGAFALGFNFYPQSARYVTPQGARRIIAGLPAAVLSVGVFVNEESPERVARMMDEAGVAMAQLHGDESPEYCQALAPRRIIKAFRVKEGFNVESILDYEVEAVLLDSFSVKAMGGTGESFDWSVARKARDLSPQLYLAGGISHENVRAAIESVNPYAVDACSGIEIAPGRKDSARMRALIRAARS